MTTNFAIVEKIDLKYNMNFIEDINKIEEAVLSEKENITLEIDSFKFIEKLISVIIEDNDNAINKNDSLISKIHNLYKLKYNQNLPQAIDYSYNKIRIFRNNKAHHNDFKIDIDIIDKIEILRALFNLINFIYVNFIDCDEVLSKQQFSTKFYYSFGGYKKNKTKNNFNIEIKKKIEVNKTNLFDILISNKYILEIPMYQRTYKWTKLQMSLLLEDVINRSIRTDKSKYFGTLACAIDSEQFNNNKKILRIIDGQQRITSSLIIFRVIYDLLFYVKKYKLIDNSLLDFFKGSVNIINPNYDHDADEINLLFRHSNNLYDSYNIIKNKNNFASNYILVYELLKDKDCEELNRIYFYYANKYIMSLLILEINKTEEMFVFNNLNTTGRRLESYDLLKNGLLLKLDDYSYKDENILSEAKKIFIDSFKLEKFEKIKINDNEWFKKDKEKIFSSFLINFIPYKLNENMAKRLNDNHVYKENNFNENKKNKSSSYLENGKINNIILVNDILNFVYKNQINISINEYEKICNDISKYFYLYLNIYLIKKDINSVEDNAILSNFDNNLDILLIKDVTIPIFFKLIDKLEFKYKIDDNRVKWLEINSNDIKVLLVNKILFLVEKWIIGITIAGGGESLRPTCLKFVKFLNDIIDCQSLVNNESEIDNILIKCENWLKRKNGSDLPLSLSMKSGKDISIKLANGQLKSVYQKLILRRIDDYLTNLNTNKTKAGKFKNPTIEHIIPKKFESTWKNDFIKWTNNNYNETTVKKWIDNIGNLILMDGKQNIKLQNKPFLEKKISYKNIAEYEKNIPFIENTEENSLATTNRFDIEFLKKRALWLTSIVIDEVYKYDE